MEDETPEPRQRRLTARGEATRTRIMEAANSLFFGHGVAATTLDAVVAAAGVSKSQLYLYFPDKDALVEAVVRMRAVIVIEREQRSLERLHNIRGLERWRDALVRTNAAARSAFGCGIGAMASELADHDEDARLALQHVFSTWSQLLNDGLQRMVDEGTLRADADPKTLSIGLLAALQGGYLLAQTARDSEPMRLALNMAIDAVRSFQKDGQAQPATRSSVGPGSRAAAEGMD